LYNYSSDRILITSIQHCFPNCRCFRFKTNRWSTNMYCSGWYTLGNADAGTVSFKSYNSKNT